MQPSAEGAIKLLFRSTCWIAAHDRAHCAVVVTNYTSELSRVPGLEIENWLA
jgi:predicted nucleic acid-binding protein